MNINGLYEIYIQNCPLSQKFKVVTVVMVVVFIFLRQQGQQRTTLVVSMAKAVSLPAVFLGFTQSILSSFPYIALATSQCNS